MILFIAHRQNNLKKINQKQNSNFNGIEIDVRTNSKNIIINHDPFKKSVIFDRNLKILKKYFLIIDVKSSGICHKIYNTLKKNHKKFLFLNLIQSEFINMVQTGRGKNLMIRFSSYESFDLKNKNLKKVRWVWFDFFDKHFISLEEYKYLKKFNKKICLTSPDLLGLRDNLLKKFINHLNKNKIKVDMICAKKEKINIWKKFYKYK